MRNERSNGEEIRTMYRVKAMTGVDPTITRLSSSWMQTLAGLELFLHVRQPEKSQDSIRRKINEKGI